MVFITALQVTLVGIVAITAYELESLYSDGRLSNELMYTLLPESVYKSHVVF